jgi:hypothetical protein
MKVTGDWLYFWPNGDRSLVVNCPSADDALLLLDEQGDAELSRLKAIPVRQLAVHMVRNKHEGYVTYDASALDEQTEMDIDKARRPRGRTTCRTSVQVLIERVSRPNG